MGRMHKQHENYQIMRQKMCPGKDVSAHVSSVRDKEEFINSKISQNRQGHIKNSTQREQRWGKTVTER